jgi:hypothetical protein
MRVVTLCAALALAFCVASAASVRQNQDQPSSQDQAAKKKKKSDKDASGANSSGANSGAAPAAKPAGDKPQPLFGGSLNLKSSRQSKDTATLGFNGLDPNGQVQKAALNSPAGAGDTVKAEQVAQYSVAQAEMSTFIEDGKLNPQAAPKQASGTEQKK